MEIIVKCTCGCTITINNKPFELKENFFDQEIISCKCVSCDKLIAVFACDVAKVNVLSREEVSHEKD